MIRSLIMRTVAFCGLFAFIDAEVHGHVRRDSWPTTVLAVFVGICWTIANYEERRQS